MLPQMFQLLWSNMKMCWRVDLVLDLQVEEDKDNKTHSDMEICLDQESLLKMKQRYKVEDQNPKDQIVKWF